MYWDEGLWNIRPRLGNGASSALEGVETFLYSGDERARRGRVSAKVKVRKEGILKK